MAFTRRARAELASTAFASYAGPGSSLSDRCASRIPISRDRARARRAVAFAAAATTSQDLMGALVFMCVGESDSSTGRRSRSTAAT